jgi:Fe-S cluster biogenesis protein NfuA
MVVRVKLHGACHGCSVNQMTLKNGVETTIRRYVPQVTAVEQVLV